MISASYEKEKKVTDRIGYAGISADDQDNAIQEEFLPQCIFFEHPNGSRWDRPQFQSLTFGSQLKKTKNTKRDRVGIDVRHRTEPWEGASCDARRSSGESEIIKIARQIAENRSQSPTFSGKNS